MKNYYWILGLTPDTASEADIKSNYRKLAKKWHPDVNSAPEARKTFEEISEAYEVLSDARRRRDYDEKISMSDMTFDRAESIFIQDILSSTTPKRRDPRMSFDGSDLSASCLISFMDSLRGVESKIISIDKQFDCPKCEGYGSLSKAAGVSECPRCKGKGWISKHSLDWYASIASHRNCPDCGGKGYKIENPCPICAGVGRVILTTETTFTIPAGVNEGSILRVAGAGNQGHIAGLDGDLYITIGVEEDSVYHRQGNNIFTKIKVPFETMILGGSVSVNLPLGGTQKERIPPLRSGSWSFVIPGHGFPFVRYPNKSGNLIVAVEPEYPSKLTDEEQELLEKYSYERRRERRDTPGTDQEGEQQGQEKADTVQGHSS